MQLEFLFKDWSSGGGGCPALYATDRGTHVVQGWTIGGPETAQLRQLADNEAGVEIPTNILEQYHQMRLREDGLA
jgi:hypothetical protein